ncbi:MAG: hypothetical protein ACK5LF_16485 [Bacteroides xylanisolvens]
MEKKKIQAFFKEDVHEILQTIDELTPIENGERICRYCSKTINLQNIQLIIPRKEKQFDYVCDNPNCIKDYNK